VTGRRLAILGLSFKEGTDDVRESRAWPIIEELARRGAEIRAYDPVSVGRFRNSYRSGLSALPRPVEFSESLDAAISSVDGIVLQCAWPEFLEWSPERTARMRRPVLVDLRRVFPAELASRTGLHLRRLGDGRTFSEAPKCAQPESLPPAESGIELHLPLPRPPGGSVP
jgi:UDP-N-acetyl-D-mannosaminuronate dehydrogenase